MRRRTSPVQQWVDSLPSPAKSSPSSLGSISRQQSVSADLEPTTIPKCTVEQVISEKGNYIRHSNMTVSTPIPVPNSPAIVYPGVSRLARDPSFQSDSSHCSSVESLLELRRADPEAILLSLGFGGGASSPQDSGPLSRIPKRFLQPSRLKGIAIDEFVKHQQETSESLDFTSLGYRGLTGSPYVAPSEIVQKIMQRLREHENHELDAYTACESYPMPQQEGRLSVLSPDNRQFLDRPRSKSPDMRNKRMIIGQRSFAFGCDGDLIEIHPASTQTSQESDDPFDYPKDNQPTINRSTDTASQTSSTESSCDSPTKSTLNHDNRDSTETVIHNKSSIPSSLDKNHNEAESPRRASEGSCPKTPDLEEGRRHSDGIMQKMKKTDSPVVIRKKSLKRQARIEAEEEETAKCSHCGQIEMEEEHDDEAAVSCCYKKTSQNCWKEMERVLQKNKKLEDVVAKSRREMAEIRDMLSTVLSVRMEPGF